YLHAFLSCFVFFFSSRRRHTRFSRDWSSDVCSSDLGEYLKVEVEVEQSTDGYAKATSEDYDRRAAEIYSEQAADVDIIITTAQRSEERRVGKECRSRGSPSHAKRKKHKQKT